MNRVLRLAAVPIAIALLFASCSSNGTTADPSTKVTAVAAFYPLAFAAQRIGGDRVTVRDLTPNGAEPHDLEPTADQVDAIQDASLVIVMGRGFQPSVEKAASKRSKTTVEVLDALNVT